MKKVSSAPCIFNNSECSMISMRLIFEHIVLYNPYCRTLFLNLQGLCLKQKEEVEKIFFVAEELILKHSPPSLVTYEGGGKPENSGAVTSNTKNQEEKQCIKNALENASGAASPYTFKKSSCANSASVDEGSDESGFDKKHTDYVELATHLPYPEKSKVKIKKPFVECFVNYDDTNISESIFEYFSCQLQLLTKRYFKSLATFTLKSIQQKFETLHKELQLKGLIPRDQWNNIQTIGDKFLVDFDFIIGEGSFGKVAKGVDRETGEIVAVKILLKRTMELLRIEDYVKREIDILKNVDHPNIVKMLQCVENDSHIYLIMEYLPTHNLGTNEFDEHEPIQEERARKFFIQILSAIEHLQTKHKVMHRDLQESNICLDADGNAKLVDFGCADYIRPNQKNYKFCGNNLYVPPEVLLQKGYYGTEYDLWSLGVVLFKMVTGYLPFHSGQQVITGKFAFDLEYEDVSNECKHLIKSMLSFKPEDRPSIDEIKKHKWLNTCAIPS